MVKVYGEAKHETTMADMQDGDIAVITDKMYEGDVVQYVGDYRWVNLGKTSGKGWHNPSGMAPGLRVRILPPGTLLEICEN